MNKLLVSIFCFFVFITQAQAATPPVYISGSVSPNSALSGSQFTFSTEWRDNDDPYIVNTRVRYRKQGNSSWIERSLGYVGPSGSNVLFRGSFSINGTAGIYDYQFRASASSTASSSGIASNWSSSRQFTITSATATPPTYRSGGVSPSNAQSGSQFTFTTEWRDNDDPYIVNVRVRYRKNGTSSWTERSLGHNGSPNGNERFRSSFTISGAGTYTYQFRADASKTASNSGVSSNWSSSRQFTITSATATPPTYRSGGVSPSNAQSGSQFTFTTEWRDNDDPYIVNVRVRYRKQGASSWTEHSLPYISTSSGDSLFRSGYVITGAGDYEYQFRADASKTASATGVSSSWSTRRVFVVSVETPQGVLPTDVLSPVKGALVLANGSTSKWAFNQHKTGFHGSNKGVGGADDTYAWDINLNTPVHDSDNGKPVYAAEAGIITTTYAGSINVGGSFGQLLIEHQNGSKKWWTGYLHMKNIQVSKGSTVTKDTIIGYISGKGATNNHLHFSVYSGENKKNELKSFNLVITERGNSTSVNSPPTLESFSTSSSTVSVGRKLTFSSTWKDPENRSIVDVKVRYRQVGNQDWVVKTLDYVSGYTFEKEDEITGSIGTYEYQFKASDADTPSGIRTNTTDWLSAGTFIVTESTNDSPKLTVTKNLPACETKPNSKCVAVGHSTILKFDISDIDNNLSRVDVDWDGSGTIDSTEKPHNISGSSANITADHIFQLSDVQGCSSEFRSEGICWGKLVTVTATAYDSLGLASSTYKQVFTLYDNTGYKKALQVIKDEKLKKQAALQAEIDRELELTSNIVSINSDCNALKTVTTDNTIREYDAYRKNPENGSLEYCRKDKYTLHRCSEVDSQCSRPTLFAKGVEYEIKTTYDYVNNYYNTKGCRNYPAIVAATYTIDGVKHHYGERIVNNYAYKVDYLAQLSIKLKNELIAKSSGQYVGICHADDYKEWTEAEIKAKVIAHKDFNSTAEKYAAATGIDIESAKKGIADGVAKATHEIINEYKELPETVTNVITGVFSLLGDFISEPVKTANNVKAEAERVGVLAVQIAKEITEAIPDLPAAISHWDSYDKAKFISYVTTLVAHELAPTSKLKLLKLNKFKIPKWLTESVLLVRLHKSGSRIPKSNFDRLELNNKEFLKDELKISPNQRSDATNEALSDLQSQNNKPIGNIKNNKIVGANFEKLEKQRLASTYPNLRKENMKTPDGELRKLDWYYADTGLAIECKVGKLSNNAFIRKQIKKDAELLKAGNIDEVRWHLTISPSTGNGGIKSISQKLQKYIDDINADLINSGKPKIVFKDIITNKSDLTINL